MSPAARQFWIIVACALGLAMLVRGLNHHLAVWQIHLSVAGLLVAQASLRLHPRAALASSFAIGLAIDAVTPVAFGENALLLLAASALVIGARHRIPREELPVGIAVAIIVNLLHFLARTLLHLGHWPDPASGWLRVFADLVASQLFIALVAPWFFALQRHSLAWFGANHPAATAGRF